MAGVCGPGRHVKYCLILRAAGLVGPAALPVLLVGAVDPDRNRTCRTHSQIKPPHNSIVAVNTITLIIQHNLLRIFGCNFGVAFVILRIAWGYTFLRTFGHVKHSRCPSVRTGCVSQCFKHTCRMESKVDWFAPSLWFLFIVSTLPYRFVVAHLLCKDTCSHFECCLQLAA